MLEMRYPILTTERDIDKRLVERVQQGDKMAFDLLVTKYQRKLFRLVLRLVTNQTEAEDVVQDAFFRLQSAPQITSSFKAQLSYLFQIVRNLAIDHYRKQALEQKYSGTEEEGLNVVIHGASPETSHINFSTLERIAVALTELPNRTRYAFEMYRLHGVQQKDIAKQLGVSPTLVNFMIRDALVHCRRVSGIQPDTFARR